LDSNDKTLLFDGKRPPPKLINQERPKKATMIDIEVEMDKSQFSFLALFVFFPSSKVMMGV
jgi:hypothetical protein